MATQIKHPDHGKLIQEYLEQVDVEKLKILTPETYRNELDAARHEGYQLGYRSGLQEGYSKPDPALQLKTAKNRLSWAEHEVADWKGRIEVLEKVTEGKVPDLKEQQCIQKTT